MAGAEHDAAVVVAEGPRYRRWTVVALAASIVFTAGALALLALIGGAPRSGSWESVGQAGLWDGMMLIANVIAVLLARVDPANRLGRWLAAGGTVGTFAVVADQWAAYSLEASPGALPGGTIALLLSSVALFTSWSLVGSHVALRFPNGRLPSRRWRLVAHVATASAVLCAIEIFHPDAFSDKEVFIDLRGVSNPIGIPGFGPIAELAFGIGILALFGATFLGLASLVVRYRRSSGLERVQLRWVAFTGVGVAVISMIAANLANVVGDPARGVLLFIASIAPLLIITGLGVAVLRHNLFDLNLVIKRTLVATVLAAFVTIAYVAIAVAAGAVLGSDREADLPVSIIATAIVAVGFQPVRRRVEMVVNRLVYGDVVAPYELMSGLSRRMTDTISPDDVLGELAAAVGRGLRAAAARVELNLPAGSRGATWLPAGATPADDYQLSRPVLHKGEVVGAIEVAVRRDDPPGAAELRILDDLVSQAGVTLHNLRLTAELELRLDELQASRQRLVEAQNEERRKMERDIHDGAQQQLVALQIKLGLAQQLLDTNPAQAGPVFDDLRSDAREALETLRDLARGLFPPTLVERGIGAALRSHVEKVNLPATVEDADLANARFEGTIEAAVYFCIREALQNASKHAAGTKLTVNLAYDRGSRGLSFAVADDGPGFDPDTVIRGSGLQNMIDRIEALDGSLRFVTAPGAGTTVAGHVPAEPVDVAGAPEPAGLVR